jgi:hypothetical protein
MLDIKCHTTLEVTEQVAGVFGEITHKLNERGLLMEHAHEFISFYKEMLSHSSSKINDIAVHNLPCMHAIFKDVQEQNELSFFNLYSDLVTQNGDGALKLKAISSFHEVFVLLKSDDDTTEYRNIYMNLLTDDNKEVMRIINKHLVSVIYNWLNEFFRKQIKPSPTSNLNSNGTGTSNANETKGVDNDFSGVANKKQIMSKKRNTSHFIDMIREESSDDSKKNLRPNIFITDDSSEELIYTDMLDNLMIFVSNLKNQEGNWREHLKLI